MKGNIRTLFYLLVSQKLVLWPLKNFRSIVGNQIFFTEVSLNKNMSKSHCENSVQKSWNCDTVRIFRRFFGYYEQLQRWMIAIIRHSFGQWFTHVCCKLSAVMLPVVPHSLCHLSHELGECLLPDQWRNICLTPFQDQNIMHNFPLTRTSTS